ncbi:hypothetical protein NZK35_02625 [Stieleria sp. ICT_E10.1]|uniref:hypothetical protein n=1 Tax=Stieleria sedimenti TaxID=2976331 RepID=UPI00217FE30F|nr:hypothetical protein [Stieleria sedimenti]MCS7465564.1 hypothetical protein [Stieleria sedimenti]
MNTPKQVDLTTIDSDPIPNGPTRRTPDGIESLRDGKRTAGRGISAGEISAGDHGAGR